jgi:hypothetical protein
MTRTGNVSATSAVAGIETVGKATVRYRPTLVV